MGRPREVLSTAGGSTAPPLATAGAQRYPTLPERQQWIHRDFRAGRERRQGQRPTAAQLPPGLVIDRLVEVVVHRW